jgi:hypothetical protein
MTLLTTPCIIPALSTGVRGYNVAHFNGKNVGKHRLEYCRAAGTTLEAIKGKVVMHKCDNPACCNPDHLVLGTQKDNMQDMAAKGRYTHNGCRGETAGQAKLTEAQAIAILINKPYRTNTQLAVEFGVKLKTVSDIRLGKTWKHLHEELNTNQ